MYDRLKKKALSRSARLLSLLSLLGLAGLGLFGTQPAEAHGVGYRESEVPPISLEFFYSTGELMSYLEAQVYAPKDAEFEYQSGRTDEDGRFAFTPNEPGEWRVVVKDDEGHRAEAVINVTQVFLDGGQGEEGGQRASSAGVVAKAAAPEGAELYMRAGLGVSLLFNVAAFVSLVRRRRAA